MSRPAKPRRKTPIVFVRLGVVRSGAETKTSSRWFSRPLRASGSPRTRNAPAPSAPGSPPPASGGRCFTRRCRAGKRPAAGSRRTSGSSAGTALSRGGTSARARRNGRRARHERAQRRLGGVDAGLGSHEPQSAGDAQDAVVHRQHGHVEAEQQRVRRRLGADAVERSQVRPRRRSAAGRSAQSRSSLPRRPG